MKSLKNILTFRNIKDILNVRLIYCDLFEKGVGCMVDKELLSAISDLMDEKLVDLKEDVSGLKEDVSGLKEDVSGLKEDVSGLKEDVSGLKEDVSRLQRDVCSLEEGFTSLRGEVRELRADVDVMKADMDIMKTDMDVMKNDIKKVQLTQENEIIPVLNDLSVCYKDTYDRYRQGIDEHEEMKRDISVLKTVVSEHSVMLQRIS